jgi:hypothetical protein
MRVRLVLALFLVVGVVAACGGDDGGTVEAGDDGSSGSADPDTPVSSPPVSDPPDDTGIVWARIEPTEDLVSPTVATPEEMVPDPEDPNAVLVHFYGGVRECYGARATVVEQSATRVRIRVETGTLPDLPPDTACIEIAEAQELKVTLDAPVADRELEAATS